MRHSKDLILRFLKNNFWRSVVVLTTGSALAQFIGLVTTPIVSRLYTSEAFGQYFLIVSIATIIVSISSLGLNSAVMAPIDDDECDEVLWVAFISSLFIATIVLVLMILISPHLKFFDSGISYVLSCFLVYFFVIASNLKGLLTIYTNRRRLNKVLFYNSLIGALSTLFITIPLGILNYGGMGLIIGSIIAALITIFQMILHTNPFKKIPSKETFINVFEKYKDYMKYQYPSNFISSFAMQLPMPIFSTYFGITKLGAYSMNDKLLGVPSRFVAAPIGTIYFRTISEHYRKNENFSDFTFALITKIMLLAFLPISIVIFCGEPIFEWFLGSGWGEAGKLAAYLVVYYVFAFCESCTSYCRVALQRQKANFSISLLRLVIVLISLFIGIYFFKDLDSVIICFVAGSSIYYIVDMWSNFRCMQKNSLKYLIFTSAYFSLIIAMWIVANRI